jgi:hypothetical protein
MSVITRLPYHLAEKCYYAFGDMELPEVEVVSNYEYTRCISDDDGTVTIQIRSRDYGCPVGFEFVHEMGHWYHCTQFPYLTEELPEKRAEAAALFVEMVVFMDPDSPYFRNDWLRRVPHFDSSVVGLAVIAFGLYMSEPENFHHIIEHYILGDE